jgi:hypothetical protein
MPDEIKKIASGDTPTQLELHSSIPGITGKICFSLFSLCLKLPSFFLLLTNDFLKQQNPDMQIL